MFKSIFTNSAGILTSRVLGFVRDVLTASILGANIYSDIFFVAFKLPNLFRRIFAEGAFTQAFLPSFTHTHHKGVFSITVFTLLLSAILILTLLVNLFPCAATKAIAIGFSVEENVMAAPFVALNFFYLIFIFSVTFLSAFLQYKHHFATTAFATALLNITLIGALLIARGSPEIEIVQALSYGVLVGGALQLIVHIIAIYKLGVHKLLCAGVLHFSKKAQRAKKDSQKFFKQFIPAIWGNSSAQLSAFIDTWLASFLVSGSISYLYYANRVYQLPLALFAIATTVAVFPKVAKHIKHNRHKEALQQLKQAFWFLTAFLSLFSVGGIILSHEVTQLLFQRGEFTTHDTLNTSSVLRMYLIGLIPYGLSKLLSLWLYAHQQQLKAAKIATVSLSFNIILSLLLIIPMGASGLALASSLAGFVNLLLVMRSFGKENLYAILSLKFTLLTFFGLLIFTLLILQLKEIIVATF